MSRDVDTAVVVLLLALAASLAAGGATKVVSTVAGRPGVWSIIDGTLAEAAFSRELNCVVELDPFGNLYYSELTAIRMVTSTRVTTIAGSSSSGTADGIGTAARFTELFSVQFEPTGQIMYICDNHAIRQMVMSNRSVTTIAGIKGSPGSADGTPGQFYLPWDVTVLDNGSLAVTDNHNHAIRIVVGNEVWTIAGQKQAPGHADGEYTDARFYFPQGIETAADGVTLFVADAWGCAIRRIVDHTVTTIAGMLGKIGYADGTGSQARFNGPAAIKRWGSVLYVVDGGYGFIRRVDISYMSSGVVTTIAGIYNATTSLDGPVTNATLRFPTGLAVAPNFTMYFVQHFTRTIRQIACPAGYVGEDCDS